MVDASSFLDFQAFECMYISLCVKFLRFIMVNEKILYFDKYRFFSSQRES